MTRPDEKALMHIEDKMLKQANHALRQGICPHCLALSHVAVAMTLMRETRGKDAAHQWLAAVLAQYQSGDRPTMN